MRFLPPVVAKPWLTGGTSKAALVRKIDLDHPTLLLDESDAAFASDKEYAEALRGVLNNGYTPRQAVHDLYRSGRLDQAPRLRRFRRQGNRGPRQVAGHGRRPLDPGRAQAPGALGSMSSASASAAQRPREPTSRTISISFARRTASPPWTGPNPNSPNELGDRAQDVWEPRFAIADLAGGGWPERSRDAATRLSGEANPDEASYGVRLLADIKAVFGDGRRDLNERDLLAHLYGIEEAPWGEWEIKPKRLADLLRPYGITGPGECGSETRRREGIPARAFGSAWSRYLAPSPPPNATSATTAYSSHKSGGSKRNIDPHVADGKGARKPAFQCGCCGCCGREAHTAEQANQAEELHDCTVARDPTPRGGQRATG